MSFSPEALRAKKLEKEKELALTKGSDLFNTGGAGVDGTVSEPLIEGKTQAEGLIQATEAMEKQSSFDTAPVEEPKPEQKGVEHQSKEEPVESLKESLKVVAVGNSEEGVTATILDNPVEVHAPATAPESMLTVEPSIGDSTAFKKLSQSSEEDAPVTDSYAELVENMVSRQCQLSGVKNLDLTTFGIRAQILSFPNLTVLNYGKHKFLGRPFTQQEEDSIIHKIGLYVAQSEKKELKIKAVQEVKDENGMSFYSLLFNDQMAQKFANMFNYTVSVNINEADVSKLALIVQK